MSRDALVAGINKYPFLKDSTGNYKHLKTPASDAEAITKLLEADHNFRVNRFIVDTIDVKSSQVAFSQSTTFQDTERSVN